MDRKDWPEDALRVQESAEEASWDALERYRDTGEMVPVMKDGRLALVTVDEAMRMRNDYERRKAENAAWRRKATNSRPTSGSASPQTGARPWRTISHGFTLSELRIVILNSQFSILNS